MGKNGTKYSELLKKEQLRIKRFIKNAERRGFIFGDNILPKTPKKPTQASVDRLKKITPEQLYKKAKYVTENGKIITGIKGRELERKASAKKAVNTKRKAKSKIKTDTLPKAQETIIGNVANLMPHAEYEYINHELNSWTPQANWSKYWISVKGHNKDLLSQTLFEAVDKYGIDIVAERLQQHGNEIERIVNMLLYGSDREQIQFDLSEFATIVENRSLTMEECAKITEELENFNGYENTPI